MNQSSQNGSQSGIGENEQNASEHLPLLDPNPGGKPLRQSQAQIQADLPIKDPTFSAIGGGQEIVPGVMFHEVVIRKTQHAGFSSAGLSGKIWLYLPKGNHQPASLPCVLITSAGSNLISGAELDEGDRPEHLPYAKAGFAVVAYELDGALNDPQSASQNELGNSTLRFLAAQAGLVNARNALRFTLTTVREVNPERVYAAGHGSAATMALLFAEYEPRIQRCVAFAPVIDVNQRIDASTRTSLISVMPQIGEIFTKYNPAENEGRLRCPLFLFHAEDDNRFPVAQSVEAADRLRKMGKNVTFVQATSGGHYDSMIREGIPSAIAWLNREPEPEQTK